MGQRPPPVPPAPSPSRPASPSSPQTLPLGLDYGDES